MKIRLPFWVLFFISMTSLFGQMSVALTSSASQVPLGTAIAVTAQASGAGSDPVWFRFRVQLNGQDYQMLRDFGPKAQQLWAPSLHEGTYQIEVTALDVTTNATAVQTAIFQVTPLATRTPVLTPTSHPLVYLYSAPGC